MNEEKAAEAANGVKSAQAYAELSRQYRDMLVEELKSVRTQLQSEEGR